MAHTPEEWSLDEFRAKHKSGLSIWTGNGVFGYHIEKPEYHDLDLFARFKLHSALKTMKKKTS